MINKSNKLFKDEYDKYCCLLLFIILCVINFVIFYLDNILDKNNKFFFRIKFICYYYFISSVIKLVNFLSNNKQRTIGIDKYNEEIIRFC